MPFGAWPFMKIVCQHELSPLKEDSGPSCWQCRALHLVLLSCWESRQCPVKAKESTLMESHCSHRFIHPIFFAKLCSPSSIYVSHTLSTCPRLPVTLCPSVFVSLIPSSLLWCWVFSRGPGHSPLCSSQPFADCASGLTDVNPPSQCPHSHYHPLACPWLRYQRCVHGMFQPAKHGWFTLIHSPCIVSLKIWRACGHFNSLSSYSGGEMSLCPRIL